MKRKLFLAAVLTALLAGSALLVSPRTAAAGSLKAASSADISEAGFVVVSAYANNFDGKRYFVNMTFVRIPGTTDWAPGIMRVVNPNGSTNFSAFNINEDPFVVDFSSHSTAFLNAAINYNGKPATLSAIVQGPSMNRVTLVVIGSSGQSLLTLSGGLDGLVIVEK